jgi:CheY-like chemotaxis protein
MGFEVVSVSDGRQALQAARRGGVDAIVSDVLMPVLDGFMLCHEARKDPALSRVPIILASNAYIGDRDRDLALKAGATAFVARTPRLDGVIDVLLRHVGTAPLAPESHPDIEREHAERVAVQLDRRFERTGGIGRSASAARPRSAFSRVSRPP